MAPQPHLSGMPNSMCMADAGTGAQSAQMPTPVAEEHQVFSRMRTMRHRIVLKLHCGRMGQ